MFLQLIYLGMSLAGSALLMRWVLSNLDPEKGNKQRVGLQWVRPLGFSWLPHTGPESNAVLAGQGAEADGAEAAAHEDAQHQQL